MARGWESKGVESQIEDRQLSRQSDADRQAAETRERDQKRASLEVQRRRIQRELEAAHSDTHRTALKNALNFLDAEIRKLD